MVNSLIIIWMITDNFSDISEYFIDDIYNYVDENNAEAVFIKLMYFKKILNRLYEVKNCEETIEVVALELRRI